MVGTVVFRLCTVGGSKLFRSYFEAKSSRKASPVLFLTLATWHNVPTVYDIHLLYASSAIRLLV